MVRQLADSIVPIRFNFLEQLKSPSESADYRAWRNTFFQGRLRLCLWLGCVCLLTFVARDWYDALFHLEEMAEIPQPLKQLFPLINGVMVTLLALCLVLRRTAFGQRHPSAIFLGLSWSITLVPQVITTIAGFPCPDLLGWSLVFLTQAALIPVYWRLHLLAQAGAIAYYLGVYPLLGLTYAHGESIYNLSISLYLFWFCFICNLAVYLYERLQQAEFESRRELQVFLHTITHDLRTPVMGASMVLQSLLSNPADQIVVNRHVLERMLQGSDRQMHLLNSLLEAHTCEQQGIELQLEPVPLSSIVSAALHHLNSLMTTNQVVLSNYIRDDLPLVNGDSAQLLRVFSNLITNALKHNPPGVHLTLDATVEGKMIRCLVQDNGVGMVPHQCRQLFDLYSRGRGARYRPGLGFGLYLCRQIIHAHGGQIGIISTPGKGATFWFTIPLHRIAN